jgi:hypothetical protein
MLRILEKLKRTVEPNPTFLNSSSILKPSSLSPTTATRAWCERNPSLSPSVSLYPSCGFGMALLSSSSSVCCSIPSNSFHTTNLFFLFTKEPSRSIRVRHRGLRPLSALTSMPKPQTQQDKPVPVRTQPGLLEEGKYSYEVESLVERINRLPPRGSIKKCIDSCKNKLSISDFALVYR